jgi:hypothetical protein
MKRPELDNSQQQEEGDESEESGAEEEKEEEELEEGEAKSSSNTSAEAGELKRELSDDEDAPVADDCNFVTPINRNKKRKLIMPPTSDHGSTSICIPGTPIVTVNESGVEKVPDWEKFSKDICDHKPFEMDLSHTPTGNFKKIIELTNQFKQGIHQTGFGNNNNSSFS